MGDNIGKHDIRRRYLQKLLRAFLGVSVIPLVLCIVAIVVSSYIYSYEQYDRQMQSILQAGNSRLEKLIEEHIDLVASLASSIYMYGYDWQELFQHEGTGYEIVSTMMAGRKERINIHLFSTDGFDYHTGGGSNLYDLKTYGQWGILSKMSKKKGEVVIAPACFGQGAAATSFSIGKVIHGDSRGDLYIIIDIMRQAVLEQLLADQEPMTDFLLVDSQGIVILDTRGAIEAGIYLDVQSYVQQLQGGGDIGVANAGATFVGTRKSEVTGYTLVTFLPAVALRDNLKNLIVIAVPILLFVLCLCFFIANRLTRSLYRPIDRMVNAISAISDGDLTVRMDTKKGNDELDLVSSGFNQMIDRINELLNKVVEQSKLQNEAEFKALQAQINPHFLYNMLNEIKALTKLRRNDEAVNFVVCLGKLLRNTISETAQFVSINEDMSFVAAYLNLQKIRYENSFAVEVEVDAEILEGSILKLVLQPIIENAILHGLANCEGDGLLRLRGYRQGEQLCFEVYDNGCGVNPDYIHYINNVSKGASMYGSHGLENVQKRLMLFYGPEYGIQMESQQDRYTIVRVNIPWSQEGIE